MVLRALNVIAQLYASCRDEYADQLIEYAGMAEEYESVRESRNAFSATRAAPKNLEAQTSQPTSIVRFVRANASRNRD
jgi:hypothetical protein